VQAHSGAANPGRRPVAMLTHSYYEEDPRVRREAETLAAAGRPVVVYALRRPDDPPHGELEGVRTSSATRGPESGRTCGSTWRSSSAPASP
jgi:hypothetical protein